MDKVFTIKANRRIVKLDIKKLAGMISEAFGIDNKIDIITLLKEWSTEYIDMALMLMRSYKWDGVYEVHNIVPNVALQDLARRIIWEEQTTFEAKYIALWSWNLAPIPWDIQLWSETLRDEFTNRYRVWNTAYLDKFFSTNAVAGDTYLEAGVFIDWDENENTWTLLSRILMNETVSANETLSINVSITFKSAT